MELFHREKYLKKIRAFYHDPEIIKVITGIRRCGKSCLMQQIAYEVNNLSLKGEASKIRP